MAEGQRYQLGADAIRQIQQVVRAEMLRQHPVIRDRGRWNKKGGSSGAEIVRFTVNSADCDVTPKTASVNVDAIICNGASVAIDDTITVYDNAGCLLNEPEADLAGRVGFAVKLLDAECQWEVLQMCCPTNQCS